MDLPAHLIAQYRNIVLAANIMFINRITFFVTTSRYIKLGTTEMLQDQQAKSILLAVQQVWRVYMRRGFIVLTIMMDG